MGRSNCFRIFLILIQLRLFVYRLMEQMITSLNIIFVCSLHNQKYRELAISYNTKEIQQPCNGTNLRKNYVNRT